MTIYRAATTITNRAHTVPCVIMIFFFLECNKDESTVKNRTIDALIIHYRRFSSTCFFFFFFLII